jgi:hypothetical protein
VAWDRLDRLLRCDGCASWYKFSASASLVEVSPPKEKINVAVRTLFSQWTDHQLTLPQRRNVHQQFWRNFQPRHWWARLDGLQSLAFVGSTLAAVLLVCWCMTQLAGSVGASVSQPPPPGLDDRVPLLAYAWLDGDLPQMLRLTDPGRDRDLRRWLQKTTPPVNKESRQHTLVEVASIDRSPKTAQVVVNIKLVSDGVANSEIVQRQTWVQKNDIWYFLPTLPPSKKTPVRQPSRT